MTFSQVQIEPQSIKSKIADSLVATIRGISRIKYVEFDKVRLYADDFKDFEMPAVQFIDIEELVVHERLRARRTWRIRCEVIHKPTENEYVSQRTMWNLEYQIARAIWANPQLGVKGVIQASYISNNTDLHLIEPFYMLTLDFQVEYYESLVGDC